MTGEEDRFADAALQMIVDAARAVVGPCESAGVTLATRRGTITTWAATDSVARRGDELQLQLDQGPCRDAVWDQRTVVVRDLPHERRWRRWAPVVAEELGVRSMLCLRLCTDGERVGALTLYAVGTDAFSDADVEVARAVAAHATSAIVAAEGMQHPWDDVVDRGTIGLATGLLMNGYAMTSSSAFAALVRMSTRRDRALSTVAADLVTEHDRVQSQRPAPARRT